MSSTEQQAETGSNLTLDQLRDAFPAGPKPDGWEDLNPDYYRRQKVTVRTDRHNATSEVAEETWPLFRIGFIVAYQRLMSINESEKTERMKQLETLMWETITQEWGVDKWTWRSRWYVVGFEPPEPRVNARSL
jgi:hypothetical protein